MFLEKKMFNLCAQKVATLDAIHNVRLSIRLFLILPLHMCIAALQTLLPHFYMHFYCLSGEIFAGLIPIEQPYKLCDLRAIRAFLCMRFKICFAIGIRNVTTFI
jgi:hypothetical protein